MKRKLAVSLLMAGAACAQEKTAIQTSGEEVLVDVVVRDAKGHAVTNLDRQAFTVLDAGAAREIASFRLVKGAEAVSEPSTGSSTTQKLDALRQVRMISLIFDRLSQSERTLTREVAMELLKSDLPPNVYMAVFTLGEELQAIQGFTNQRDLLVRAVDKATSRPASQFYGDSEALRSTAEQTLGPNQVGNQDMNARLVPMATGAAAAGSLGAGADVIMARSLIEMISFAERTEMYQAGRSTIWALLGAVRGQSQMPGRKAIIYFSEGFAISQGAEEKFKAVISAANRNNLTFYPIDAHGLSTSSQNAKATEGLAAAATSSAGNATFGSSGVAGASTPKTQVAMTDDLYINANRMNIQDTLAMLADETGGFLTANTNDFRTPLRRVMEEMDTYYEITYTPHIDQYDGKFRGIDVRVSGKGLTVQSRAGYFALPPDMAKSSGLTAYEAPLLQTLSDADQSGAAVRERRNALSRRGEHGDLRGADRRAVEEPVVAGAARPDHGDRRTGVPGPDQEREGRGGEETAG